MGFPEIRRVDVADDLARRGTHLTRIDDVTCVGVYPAAGWRDPRFSTTPVYLTHRAGQLVMFPSWLYHEVLPYHGQRERIVVAFNAWLQDAQPR